MEYPHAFAGKTAEVRIFGHEAHYFFVKEVNTLVAGNWFILVTGTDNHDEPPALIPWNSILAINPTKPEEWKSQ